MAFLILLALAAACFALYRKADSAGSRRPNHTELLGQVRRRGAERRLRYLRHDIDESMKWYFHSTSPLAPEEKARMIYNEAGARTVAGQLRHGTPTERAYAELALKEDAEYVFAKSAHLDGSIPRQLGAATSLQRELSIDALSNGMGSPAETAKAVVSAYESLVRPGAPHYRVWREAFEGVLGMRAAAHVASGFTPPDLNEVNRVLRFTSVGSMGTGCLAALALGVVWLESSSRQRAALGDPEALEAVAATVLRAIGPHRDSVLLETVPDLTTRAEQFLVGADTASATHQDDRHV